MTIYRFENKDRKEILFYLTNQKGELSFLASIAEKEYNSHNLKIAEMIEKDKNYKKITTSEMDRVAYYAG